MPTCITQADLVCGDPLDESFIEFLNNINAAVKANCAAINDIPDVVDNTSGIQLLDTPVRVINLSRDKSSGTYDSGAVTFNVNTLSGVTAPSNATGVILRCGVSISGQQDDSLTSADQSVYSSIQVASSTAGINMGDAFHSGQFVNVAVYTDSNLQKNDNDNTNDVMVNLTGTSFAYRAEVRFLTSNGDDTAFHNISLVGFILG